MRYSIRPALDGHMQVTENLRKVLRRMHRGRYLPQPWSLEDIKQEQVIQLILLLGHNFETLLADDWDAYLPQVEKATNRAVGKARWRWEKRKRRGSPSEQNAEHERYDSVDEQQEINLTDYFSSLSEEHETLIAMRLEGHSNKEIAKKLGISLATLGRRLKVIKKHLVKALE